MTQLIKPAPGRKVRRPDQAFGVLPEDQETLVNWSPYWHRLAADGDIVVIDQPEAETAPAPKGKSGGASS